MNGKKFIEVLFWMIEQEMFTREDMSDQFNLNEERIDQLIDAFSRMKVLDVTPHNPMIKCLINSPETLKQNQMLIDALHGMNITDHELLTLFENKGLSSPILRTPHEWKECVSERPPMDTPVLCRLYAVSETLQDRISEDMKIAKFNGTDWEILPPFPKFDYSILSDHANLKNGVVITHWAPVKEEEMEAWNHRYDPIGTCQYLRLEVDPEHEELVYRALMYGSACMAMVYGNRLVEPEDDEDKLARKLHDVLIDLQYTMDRTTSEESDPK